MGRVFLNRSVHSLRHVLTLVFFVFFGGGLKKFVLYILWPIHHMTGQWKSEISMGYRDVRQIVLTAKTLRSYHVPRGPDARAWSDDVMRVACIWTECLRPVRLWTKCNESHEMLLNCSFLRVCVRSSVPTHSQVDKRKQRFCLPFYLSTFSHVFPEILLFPDVKEVHIFPTCVR